MNIRRWHIITFIVVFALLAFIVKPDLLSMLFVLLFMGIVPGTDITLPAWVTLLGFAIALGFGIRWLLSHPTYHPVATSKDRALRHTARKRVLKQSATRKPAARRYKKQPAKV